MKVEQIISNSSNRAIANQFELYDDNGNRFFQSYDSIIIKWSNDGKIYLDQRYWDYSTTTGKYRNQLLFETKKETQKKIDSGEYTLTDLN